VIVAATAAAVLVVGVVLVTARAQRESRTKRAAIGVDSIVMLGDSITEEGDWGALLPTWQIANRGHSGYTTAQLLDEAEDIASDRPRAVFILTGTNDIRDGHPPSWTVDRLGAIIDRLRRGAPDSQIVLQTILPRSDARDAVRESNLAIRELASERDVQVLDLYAAFDDGTGALRAAETTDGVHLAPAGYRRWAAQLEQALQALPSS
jgi:lysophospholipase L1-like esterase